MKSNVKIIVKIMVFFTIGIFIFQILTMIFVPKWMSKIDPATPRMKGFYEEEKDTIDVLVVGNSDVGRGFSPITLWNEYGITSYNLGTSNQTMSLSYYVIKEALKYQNIKTIVLDMDAAFVTQNAPEGEYRKLFDNMKFGQAKMEAIQNEDLEIEDKLSFVFPLLRFHSRWSELKSNDFQITKKYDKSISYKGMAMSATIKPYIDKKKYMKDIGEVEKIPEFELVYINKIIELCDKEKIKLLWMEIPSASSWSKARSDAVQKLANEKQIEFIDMNYKIDNFNFDWKTDTADKGNHLNIQGAEKVSKYIGNILKEKYQLKDHRNDFKYKSWYEQATRYEENKKKEEIIKMKKEQKNIYKSK